MSKIEEFLKEIQTGDLKEEYIKTCSGKDGIPVEERVELIVSFARDHGYDISPEDLALAEADMQPLDKEELSKVNGGISCRAKRDGGGRQSCILGYACSITWVDCSFSDECEAGLLCEGNLFCQYADFNGDFNNKI